MLFTEEENAGNRKEVFEGKGGRRVWAGLTQGGVGEKGGKESRGRGTLRWRGYFGPENSSSAPRNTGQVLGGALWPHQAKGVPEDPR